MTPGMAFSYADFQATLPIWILSVFGMLLMLLNMKTRKRGSDISALTALVALAAAGTAQFQIAGTTRIMFNDMYRVDGFATFFTILSIGFAAAAVLLSWDYLKRTNLPQGEFYALILFATLGMIFLAAANDLVMIFLGIELMSLALYVLAGFRKNRFESNEAALKYFLLGAFATGFLLYGIALVYGATGTTNLSRIGGYLIGSPALKTPLLLAGGLLTFVGFAFKVSLVPFHMWTPDAYEGAPTTATGFMAAGAKAAGFAGLLRVVIAALPSITPDWTQLLIWLCIITMTVGNVTAILQNNLKRMLAYSSIAHAGYVLLGVIAGGAAGAQAVLFYLVVYGLQTLGAFGVVSLMGRGADERVRVTELAGAGFRHPWLGIAMSVFMLGLAGIPPLAGFLGKFYLFKAALESGHTALVVVAAINSVIAAYYYLRPVVVMYMTQPEGEALEVSYALPASLALIALVVLTFWFGVAPGAVTAAAMESVLAVIP
ncbi:MAG: NADH-quinone oxidoreductase subunit N [Candidatus Eiseniibacteriota bacterium]